MEVILTHENADFDAVASLLGASKLFPAATPVLPRRVNRNGWAFVSLYGTELPFVQPDDLPRRRKITRAILVDTQGLTTLKGMGRDLEVDVIDHHERDAGLNPNWTFSGETLGATTTLLVEEIRVRGIELTWVEATLLWLGIHEDTGSLSYAGTTARDVHAAAWLMEQGARLDVAGEFLHHPLAPAQRELYEQLLEQSETHEIGGHNVVVAWAEACGLEEEISTLAHKLRELLEPAALFVLVALDDGVGRSGGSGRAARVQIVARSTTDDIDVAEVAGHFGGGGHRRASAALVRGRSLQEVRKVLLELLPRVVRSGVTVRQIMSRGVQVLSPRDTVAEAAERMRRTGHEGFPVVLAGNVIGLLTRRAVDRALQFEMGAAPVSQVMEAGSVTVAPDDSVGHLRRVMIDSNRGQIPVVEGSRIVGVVTRTDLITMWGAPTQPAQRHEVVALLEQALSEPVLTLVRHISREAHEMGFAPYFVGGLVRDLLLGAPIVDVDMVIEGDGIALANRLSEELGGRVIAHKRFGTAKWLLTKRIWRQVAGRADHDDLPPSVDFASARTEFYIYPTALPKVERSSIKQDLHRRDFTINTLAIRLDPDHWGALLDFYGGESDLREGVIRVLHSLSFADDPTRMLRAARLESRLGFRLDPRSGELIADALPLLKRVSGDRIRHELEQIFDEPEPERVLSRLEELGVLAQIHPNLRCDKWLQARYLALRQVLAREAWGLKPEDDAFLHLAMLVYRLDEEQLEAFAKRLKIKRDDADDLRLLPGLRATLPRVERARRPSAVDRLLQPFPARVLAAAWVAAGSRRQQGQVLRCQTEWRLVEPEITGDGLKAMGLRPSPLFGQLLSALREARLDGKVSTREEEEAMLQKLLADERKRGNVEAEEQAQ
ncbi:MAG: CBS domain-containing protein [Anaerolineae bacterium]|nr:CBS domain-containing protein [Anaerolineae bacterium]